MTARQRAILLICVVIFAINQFHRASGSITTPILIEELSLTAFAVSALAAMLFVSSVIFQLPLGAALDRVGPRLLMAATTGSVAVGTAIFALAQDYGQLMLARMLLGIGAAASGAAISVTLAQVFAGRDFAYYQGMIVSIGGVGGLLGTYPLALMLELLPWPVVFSILSAVAAGLAIMVLRTLPDPPPAAVTDAAPVGYLSLMGVPEIRKIMVLSLVIWAPIVVLTGLWGSAYFQTVHGFGATASGAVLFAFYLSTMVSAYGFGWLERRSANRKRLILTAALGSATLYGLMAAIPAPPAWAAIALMTGMIFVQQFYVPLSAHLRAAVPAEALGRASSLMTLAGVVGISVLQMGFGTVLDIAAAAGFAPVDAYRMGFAAVGLTVILASAVYATARRAND